MTDSATDTGWPPEFAETIVEQLPSFPSGAPLAPDAKLVDLGLTSLRMVRLLVAIEDNFDITLPDDVLSATAFETPTALWAAVRSALGDQG